MHARSSTIVKKRKSKMKTPSKHHRSGGMSLSSLGSLIAKAAADRDTVPTPPVPPAALDLGEFDFQPDDSVLVCLAKAMADCQAHGILELVRLLRPTAYNSDQIEEGLELLVKRMFVVITANNGHLKREFTMRRSHLLGVPALSAEIEASLKTNNTEEDMQRSTLMLPIAARRAPDVIGPVILEEGMDRGIWKTMADRKPRTASLISSLLVSFGFARDPVNRRVITLFRRGWFEQDGARGNTSYTLRKTIKLPVNDSADPQDDVEPEEQGMKVNQLNETVHPTVTGRDYSTNTIEGQRPLEQQTLSGLIGRSAPEEVAAITDTTPEQFKLLDTDSLAGAVWKVMQDRFTYTSNEVMLLLSGTRWAKGSIHVKISKLYATGNWFDRNEEVSPFTYVMKEGVPNPDVKATAPAEKKEPEVDPKQQSLLEEKEEMKNVAPPVTTSGLKQPTITGEDIVNAIHANPELKSLTGLADAITGTDNDLRDESNTSKSVINQHGNDHSNDLPEPAATIEIAIKIKGVSFSADEAKVICGELLGAGFGKGEFNDEGKTMRFIQLRIKVGDAELTTEEAEVVATALFNAGLVK